MKGALIVLMPLVLAIGLFAYWYFPNGKLVTPLPTQTEPQVAEASQPQTQPSSQSLKSGYKLYRNDEFGFEFQYPEKWELEPNTFGSPFSKFNLSLLKRDGKYVDFNSFLINVVTPQFADNAIISRNRLGATVTDIVVSGIEGKKYEYVFESVPTIGVDIPAWNVRILFSATKDYEEAFEQILASFRFIK